MNNRIVIHVMEPDVQARAMAARAIFSIGHHAEVYASLEELCEMSPREGVILVHDDGETAGFPFVCDILQQSGVVLPVVAMAREPATDRVVAAIKAGALDYLALPLEQSGLRALLARIGQEIEHHAQAIRSRVIARRRIEALSPREREVLDWLAMGSTNKSIARELNISPRTVEIHRANMFSKLGVGNPVDALRLRLNAQLDDEAA